MNTRRGSKSRVRIVDESNQSRKWAIIGRILSLFAVLGAIAALPMIFGVMDLDTTPLVLTVILILGMGIMVFYGQGDLDAFDDNTDPVEKETVVAEYDAVMSDEKYNVPSIKEIRGRN